MHLIWLTPYYFLFSFFPFSPCSVNQVVFANSQIIGSIAWSTGVSWPPPFSYFAKAFSIFELNIFDILPLGCIGGLNFYGYV